MLPQDIIDNTIKALSTSATSPTGYGTLGPPSGRYIAPINASGCINEYTGSCGLPKYHYVFGPNFVRFDMSLGKRIDITKRVFAEMRVELLEKGQAEHQAIIRQVELLADRLDDHTNPENMRHQTLARAFMANPKKNDSRL